MEQQLLGKPLAFIKAITISGDRCLMLHQSICQFNLAALRHIEKCIVMDQSILKRMCNLDMDLIDGHYSTLNNLSNQCKPLGFCISMITIIGLIYARQYFSILSTEVNMYEIWFNSTRDYKRKLLHSQFCKQTRSFKGSTSTKEAQR